MKRERRSSCSMRQVVDVSVLLTFTLSLLCCPGQRDIQLPRQPRGRCKQVNSNVLSLVLSWSSLSSFLSLFLHLSLSFSPLLSLLPFSHQIPPVLMEVLSGTSHCHMYGGCVVCEVRNYRHSSPSPSSPSSRCHFDSHLIMLRPTAEVRAN